MLLFEDNTAAIMVKMGPFNLDDSKDYSVDVRISDGGRPIQTSVTKLAIKVCPYKCILKSPFKMNSEILIKCTVQ